MWYLFIFILLLEIILDFASSQTTECVVANPKAGWLLIFHHITSVFLLYGWTIPNKLLQLAHVLTVIGTAIYWRSNNNRCELTVHVNDICGWPAEKPFHDLLDMIGLKEKPGWNEWGHYLFIFAGGIISLWRLTH